MEDAEGAESAEPRLPKVSAPDRETRKKTVAVGDACCRKFGDLTWATDASALPCALRRLRAVNHPREDEARATSATAFFLSFSLFLRASVVIRTYDFFFLTNFGADTAPRVSASSIMADCSAWCLLPEPVAGLALAGRPT